MCKNKKNGCYFSNGETCLDIPCKEREDAMEKIQIAENQFIDVQSTRLSMKCRSCKGCVEYSGKEAWKDHHYCPYCGEEYQ